jgi:hypothetical protein
MLTLCGTSKAACQENQWGWLHNTAQTHLLLKDSFQGFCHASVSFPERHQQRVVLQLVLEERADHPASLQIGNNRWWNSGGNVQRDAIARENGSKVDERNINKINSINGIESKAQNRQTHNEPAKLTDNTNSGNSLYAATEHGKQKGSFALTKEILYSK